MTAIDLIELVLTSGSLVTLIIFIINRHDAKKDENKKIHDELSEIRLASEQEDEALKKELKKLEKDSVRTQLLLLMSHYRPEDEHELLQVAEHYFIDLDANWYLTPKFNRFLEEEKIARPEWFKK